MPGRMRESSSHLNACDQRRRIHTIHHNRIASISIRDQTYEAMNHTDHGIAAADVHRNRPPAAPERPTEILRRFEQAQRYQEFIQCQHPAIRTKRTTGSSSSRSAAIASVTFAPNSSNTLNDARKSLWGIYIFESYMQLRVCRF